MRNLRAFCKPPTTAPLRRSGGSRTCWGRCRDACRSARQRYVKEHHSGVILWPGAMPASVRTRILDSALSCFIEFGYDQTTIARIRERSQVTNGALFHHFPSKEAIADALYV